MKHEEAYALGADLAVKVATFGQGPLGIYGIGREVMQGLQHTVKPGLERVPPELLAALLGSAVGGGIGAASGDEGERLESALRGAATGGLIGGGVGLGAGLGYWPVGARVGRLFNRLDVSHTPLNIALFHGINALPGAAAGGGAGYGLARLLGLTGGGEEESEE